MVAAPMHRPSGPDRSGAWKETQVPGGACAASTEQSGGEDEYVAGALIGSQDKKFDPIDVPARRPRGFRVRPVDRGVSASESVAGRCWVKFGLYENHGRIAQESRLILRGSPGPCAE